MGGGCYSYYSASTRSADYRTRNVSREEIFKSRSLDPEMNIKGKVREARDSEEHPESFPIIISMDVTGSMGLVPEWLVKHGFPEIMKKIMDEGIEHPQVCFVGFGDDAGDEAPIQVGQFESSDELTEKWLTKIWLEGGGLGNGKEDAALTYYFAANHTAIDSFEKRGKKGVIVTISDDATCMTLSKHSIDKLFGNGEGDVTTSKLITDASEKWDIYHINLNDYLGSSNRVQNSWRELLGSERVFNTENGEGKDIPDIIAGIILRSFNRSGDDEVRLTTNKL